MFEVGKKYVATFAFGKVFECIKVGKKTAIVQNMEWEQDVMVPPLEHLHSGTWKEYKEPRTITRWVNVYEKDGELSMGPIWSSREKAIYNGGHVMGYKDTVPITYTEPH